MHLPKPKHLLIYFYCNILFLSFQPKSSTPPYGSLIIPGIHDFVPRLVSCPTRLMCLPSWGSTAAPIGGFSWTSARSSWYLFLMCFSLSTTFLTYHSTTMVHRTLPWILCNWRKGIFVSVGLLVITSRHRFVVKFAGFTYINVVVRNHPILT